MGSAISLWHDPLDTLPDEIQRHIEDPFDIFPDADRDSLQEASKESAGSVAQNTGPVGPVPSPYRRPRPTPITAERAALDRRRSIASAMRRRRAASSILGGVPAAADPLGAA